MTYRHTKYASYIGYITQAIINNLPALLFVTFNTDYGVSLEKLGLLVSVNFFTQIIVDLLSVKYVDRIGYRAGAVAAHVFAVLGLVCLSVLPRVMPDRFAALIIATCLNAVGGGLTEVLISPIIESLPGDEKAGAMSLLHSFYCWGHMAVVLLSTLYFSTVGIKNWHWLPLIWAVVPFINIFLFAKVPLRVLVEEEKQIPVIKLFKNWMFYVFLILMVCSGAAEQAMSQWSSLFAEQGLKVSKTVGDLLGPCFFALMMGISRLLYGIFGSRINIRFGLLLSGCLCVISYLVATLSLDPIVSLLGCALCGFSVGLFWPGTLSAASEGFPAGGTAMFALLALAGDMGCSAGPGLVGLLSGTFERTMEVTAALKTGIRFGVVFPIVLIAMLVLLTIGKKAKRN